MDPHSTGRASEIWASIWVFVMSGRHPSIRNEPMRRPKCPWGYRRNFIKQASWRDQTSSRKRTDFYASLQQLYIAPPRTLQLTSWTPAASYVPGYPSESLLGNMTLTSCNGEILKRKCKWKAIRTTRGMSKPPTSRYWSANRQSTRSYLHMKPNRCRWSTEGHQGGSRKNGWHHHHQIHSSLQGSSLQICWWSPSMFPHRMANRTGQWLNILALGKTGALAWGPVKRLPPRRELVSPYRRPRRQVCNRHKRARKEYGGVRGSEKPLIKVLNYFAVGNGLKPHPLRVQHCCVVRSPLLNYLWAIGECSISPLGPSTRPIACRVLEARLHCCYWMPASWSLNYLTCVCHGATSFPGSTPLSRWRLREDPGTRRYTPREIPHESWSILSRDT